MPRTYGPKQRIYRVPIYPETQAESDLERARKLYPRVPLARITQRALEIGLGLIAERKADLVPANDNGGAK